MGRRLSDWERASRDSERESRATARRAKTASRRGKERKIREKQQAAEKRAKEAQTSGEIAENKAIVSKFENYIHNLESLHNKHDLNKFEKDYENRLRARAYKPGSLKEIIPFNKEPFKIKPYNIKSYKKKTKKAKKFSMATYEKSDFKKEKEISPTTYMTVAGFLGGLTAVTVDAIVGFGIFLVVAIVGGVFTSLKNKNFASEYEKLKAESKKMHDEAEEKKKAEHDESEAKKKADHAEAEAEKKAEHDKQQKKLKLAHEEAQAKAKSDYEEQKQKKKASFEKGDVLNKKKFAENDVERIKLLENAKNGEVEAIETICESVLPIHHDIEYPEDFVLGTLDEYDVGYNVVDHSAMDILIQLPDFDDIIPSRNISVTPNGKTIRHGDMSNRARTQLFDKFVNSMAFEHIVEILRAFPYLNVFRLEAFNTVVDTKTGGNKEKIILKVVFDKETLLKLNLDKIDPVHAIENFDFKFLPSGKKSSKEIKPDIERDGIVWATPDNKGFEIPYGVHPDQKGKRLPN